MKRKRIKPKNMPQTISPVVTSVNIQEDTNIPVPNGKHAYRITLELLYIGTVDPTNQINQDEELNIEIPSHAPPPTP